jgi:hypothetical protein
VMRSVRSVAATRFLRAASAGVLNNASAPTTEAQAGKADC